MAYTLGIKPDKLKVYLWRDADFDSVITRRTEATPASPLGEVADWGTSDIRLVFPAATDDPGAWTAVVEGADAIFQVDKVLTNLRVNNEPVELWVGDQIWASGRVIKSGVLP